MDRTNAASWHCNAPRRRTTRMDAETRARGGIQPPIAARDEMGIGTGSERGRTVTVGERETEIGSLRETETGSGTGTEMARTIRRDIERRSVGIVIGATEDIGVFSLRPSLSLSWPCGQSYSSSIADRVVAVKCQRRVKWQVRPCTLPRLTPARGYAREAVKTIRLSTVSCELLFLNGLPVLSSNLMVNWFLSFLFFFLNFMPQEYTQMVLQNLN